MHVWDMIYFVRCQDLFSFNISYPYLVCLPSCFIFLECKKELCFPLLLLYCVVDDTRNKEQYCICCWKYPNTKWYVTKCYVKLGECFGDRQFLFQQMEVGNSYRTLDFKVSNSWKKYFMASTFGENDFEVRFSSKESLRLDGWGMSFLKVIFSKLLEPVNSAS